MITGCSVKRDSSTVEDKNLAELEYIETQIIEILNNYISEGYLLEDGTQDWGEILSDIQNLEEAATVTVVDLTSLNINSDDISALNTGVNNTIIAVENEDERSFLIELNNIYALIPKYLSNYSTDSELVFKKELKYYAISTYIAFVTGDLELSKSQIAEAETAFSEKMQDLEYVESNEYNMSKVYVLIEELKNAVETESAELVRTKYLNLIREI